MQHTGLTRSTCLMLHRRARDWPRTPWYLFRREGSPMACLIVSRQSALAESGHVSDSRDVGQNSTHLQAPCLQAGVHDISDSVRAVKNPWTRKESRGI